MIKSIRSRINKIQSEQALDFAEAVYALKGVSNPTQEQLQWVAELLEPTKLHEFVSDGLHQRLNEFSKVEESRQ